MNSSLDLSDWLKFWTADLEGTVSPTEAVLGLSELDRIVALELASASYTTLPIQRNVNRNFSKRSSEHQRNDR
jgi:hypothetical protein